MGGFLGIGGSSAKTDRSFTLQGFKGLSNLFNWAIPTGEEATGKAIGYQENLLSGNRTARRAAVAPEINAATATSDAAKRQQATSGTARGGGTAGVNQQRSTDLMAKVDNLLFGVAPEAAGALGAMGTNTLNTGEATAANLSGQAASSRQTSFAINRQTQQDVVAAIEAAMAIGA